MLGSPDPRALITGPDARSGPLRPGGSRPSRSNAGPQTFGMRAALRHLRAWIENGAAPPVRRPDRHRRERRDPARCRRPGARLSAASADADVDVPTRTLTGQRAPGGQPVLRQHGRHRSRGTATPTLGTAPPRILSPTPEPHLAVRQPEPRRVRQQGRSGPPTTASGRGSSSGTTGRDFVNVAVHSDIGESPREPGCSRSALSAPIVPSSTSSPTCSARGVAGRASTRSGGCTACSRRVRSSR